MLELRSDLKKKLSFFTVFKRKKFAKNLGVPKDSGSFPKILGINFQSHKPPIFGV
jgi:hypothetical protein